MKKQEIKNVAMYAIKSLHPVEDKEFIRCVDSYCMGAEMVNEKQPYSAEDMAKFGRYVKKKWTLIDTGGWIESDIKFYKPHDIKTDKQVIKLWEETK